MILRKLWIPVLFMQNCKKCRSPITLLLSLKLKLLIITPSKFYFHWYTWISVKKLWRPSLPHLFSILQWKSCARERKRARRLKKETANALPWRPFSVMNIWGTNNDSGCLLKKTSIVFICNPVSEFFQVRDIFASMGTSFHVASAIKSRLI